MCKKCDKYKKIEEQFVAHFSKEMSEWANQNGLDLMGIRNGLGAMYDTVFSILLKRAAKEMGIELISINNEERSPISDSLHNDPITSDISEDVFNDFIFGKDDGRNH